MIVLNGINVFPLTNVLTCSPTSCGGSVVDYVFLKTCDLSTVHAFKAGVDVVEILMILLMLSYFV